MTGRQDMHAPSGAPAMKHYHTRDLLLREDVIAKAKEVAELLAASEEVELFRKAEKRIREHPEIQAIIAQIKKKQKEIVAFETTFKNPDMVKKIEQEIEELQNRLDEYPIVVQFRQTQADLNYILQLVVDLIRDTLSEKIEVLTGADAGVPRGCGG